MNKSATLEPITVAISPVAPFFVITPATDQQIDSFCESILLGLPTTKILPASISDLKVSGGITADQLARIKTARKEHEENADADRKALFRLARSRRVKGARFNAAGKLIGLRLADRTTATK